TKLCAEKLFIQGNAYSGAEGTRFSCTRYGNVVGSRGSVTTKFKRQRKTGKVTVTDKRMTRFWLTLERGVKFVVNCIEQMHGGEVFVPRIPSMKVMDLAEAIAPGCEIEYIGIRPGERLHEAMISVDEARHTVLAKDRYIIFPEFPWWTTDRWDDGESLPEGFEYTSDKNDQWLSLDELRKMAEED
ncbi:MAG: polysaccharide biosynthesis protein, partial [Thermoguttaceae bacterium]